MAVTGVEGDCGAVVEVLRVDALFILRAVLLELLFKLHLVRRNLQLQRCLTEINALVSLTVGSMPAFRLLSKDISGCLVLII